MTTAAIYCRLSYAPDGRPEQVERQEADCRELAERLGWDVVRVHHDNSRSAWQRNRTRPGWDRLLAAVKRGEVDGIITWHGDRLMRQPEDLETLLRLADDHRIALASVSGVRDLSNSDHRYILRIETAQACKSSDDTSRRVRRAWKARAKEGRPSGGGKRPFGFKTLTEPDPDESAILREAAQRLLAGQSINGVVGWLNEVSTTTQGNRWTSRALHHLLVAPRIAGLVEYQDALYEAVWEPIITRQEWEDVRALLQANAIEHPHPGAQPRYLLSNIAGCGWDGGCGECGGAMTVKPSGGRNRKTSRLYYCLVCRRVGRNQYHLDEYVIGAVLRLLSESDVAEEATAEADDGSAAEIVSLERRREETRQQLANLADNPSLSPDLAASAIESFNQRIAQIRDRRASSARSRLLARMQGITREGWDATPLDVRRATVRALVTVTVLPTSQRGPGFDASAVRVERVSG